MATAEEKRIMALYKKNPAKSEIKKLGAVYKASPLYRGKVGDVGPKVIKKTARRSENVIDARSGKGKIAEETKSKFLIDYVNSSKPRATNKTPIAKQYKSGDPARNLNMTDPNDSLDWNNFQYNEARKQGFNTKHQLSKESYPAQKSFGKSGKPDYKFFKHIQKSK